MSNTISEVEKAVLGLIAKHVAEERAKIAAGLRARARVWRKRGEEQGIDAYGSRAFEADMIAQHIDDGAWS